MQGARAAAWTGELQELWARIERHDFEPDHALNFTRRLALATGWPADFARGAIAEYRRFCFLACAGSGPVTPSEEVDEVWHLHLTYSRDYWDIWCGSVLRGPLHHEPSRGDDADRSGLHRQYAETLASYERFFGPAPEAFWPASWRRFGATRRFRTIDTEHCVVLPRPSAVWRALRDRRRGQCR